MRLISAGIILMSGKFGVTCMHVLGEFKLLKLNRSLHFCLEFRVELACFCVKCFFSVGVTLRGNLWNLLLHLHELKISELSLMLSDLLVLKRERISFLSTIQMLHCNIRDDFMQRILSPCQRMVGIIIFFIFARTPLLDEQSLQRLPKCLEKASALA